VKVGKPNPLPGQLIDVGGEAFVTRCLECRLEGVLAIGGIRGGVVAIEFPGPSNVTEPLVVSDDQDHVGAGCTTLGESTEDAQ
jgi:hypothetical protein